MLNRNQKSSLLFFFHCFIITHNPIQRQGMHVIDLESQLQEMKDKLNGTEAGKKVGNTLDELQKQMDESENDLVNKRINPTLFNRQKQIETRLLEAEKAIKEQELDPKRNAKTGVTFNRATPPDLEKFKREKEKQVELLRTTPPNFTPFYKKQTDNYFKRIN